MVARIVATGVVVGSAATTVVRRAAATATADAGSTRVQTSVPSAVVGGGVGSWQIDPEVAEKRIVGRLDAYETEKTNERKQA